MSAPLESPPVHVAQVGWEVVEALFDDVAALAELREVRVKGGPEAHAAPAGLSLAAARDALRAGRVAGVQIRYTHGGQAWCDTLLRQGDGVRVVRTADPGGR